ncbi:MAG: FAD binding domain-containing protein [Bacteroidota bacterium]|nr:FAD binding domain-containing protein [Bacteroidota bacterium]
MTEFILNNQFISTDLPQGMSLLNFIREHANLKGTKSGCKEGDCGACTVLIGELKNKKVYYKSVTSCVTPLGTVQKKHVVTIEGLSEKKLNPIQVNMLKNNATQCGFCTPGIVTALTGYILTNETYKLDEAINAVSGNICRCTGYKSIEKAVSDTVKDLKANQEYKQQLPEHFNTAAERLSAIQTEPQKANSKAFIAGGTDLLVQNPEQFEEINPILLSEDNSLQFIDITEKEIVLGGGTTVSQFINHNDIQTLFPKLRRQFLLISSEQIRNTATFAGNIVNASPIGDITTFLLAVKAVLHIEMKNKEQRLVALEEFYTGYKTFKLEPGEIIKSIRFKKPEASEKFNFEKVSKRKYLDIASVNSFIKIKVEHDYIKSIRLSLGGIAPYPFLAVNTMKFLTGKKVNKQILSKASKQLNREIAPISDIRGKDSYKRLLARQLFIAHFHELFPKHTALNSEFLQTLAMPEY